MTKLKQLLLIDIKIRSLPAVEQYGALSVSPVCRQDVAADKVLHMKTNPTETIV